MPQPNNRPATAIADAPPFEEIEGEAVSPLLFLCDHAANCLPAGYGTLGLPPAELDRHIAYDIGAGPLTRALAVRLRAPALLTTYSRLLIDPNRGEDDPTLIVRLSDRTIVPGNAVDAAGRAARIARFHAPYHAAIDALIDRRLAAGSVPVIVSIHSFTPRWRGAMRPWHIGILWDADPRLPSGLIAGLAADPDLVVGDNEPYCGALRGDTLFRHATSRGLPHALIEVRQDLIADAAGIAAWERRLALLLAELAPAPQMREVRHYGSHTGPVPDTLSKGR